MNTADVHTVSVSQFSGYAVGVLCPNCGKVGSHVLSQIDAVTGEEFTPVNRLIDGRVVNLSAEDYRCQFIN